MFAGVTHICVAMKPCDGSIVENMEHGVCGLNVDECKIDIGEDDAKAMERCNSPGSGRMVVTSPPIGTFAMSSPVPW